MGAVEIMSKAKPTEADIERYLVAQVKKIGGRAYKFVSPGNAGVPDRLVVLPYGVSYFVELKAPGRKPTTLQRLQQERLADLHFSVAGCVDSFDAVDFLIQDAEWRIGKAANGLMCEPYEGHEMEYELERM